MHNTKKLLFIIGLLLFSLLLISADYAPTVELSRDNGRNTEQVKTRKQKRLDKRKVRLNKRLNKLSAQLDKTESVSKQKRLKKQIKRTTSLQEKPSKVLGIIALVLGILALILIAYLFSGFIAILIGIPMLMTLSKFIVWILFAVIIVGTIILGVIGLKKAKRFPEKFGGRKMAKAGLILGIIAASILVLIGLIILGVFINLIVNGIW
ncbi:MAG: hypothetical protein GY810_08915 [Aureispira sp.]|nr:hypothetical protein [Aureispira sp.]